MSAAMNGVRTCHRCGFTGAGGLTKDGNRWLCRSLAACWRRYVAANPSIRTVRAIFGEPTLGALEADLALTDLRILRDALADIGERVGSGPGTISHVVDQAFAAVRPSARPKGWRP